MRILFLRNVEENIILTEIARSYKMNRKITLSVIAAFYNEKNISRSYKVLSFYLRKHIPSYELIFVDDGSTIDMGNFVRLLKKDRRAKLIKYAPNRGRGYAVATGFKTARGDYALYIDSDLDISPAHIPLIVKGLKIYDIVVGNKFHPASKVKTRRIRKIASFILNSMIHIFLKSPVVDHHVGIKGFRKGVLKRLLPQIQEEKWTFDVEILYLANKVRYSIGYIPVQMTYGMEGIKLSYVRYLVELFFFIIATKDRYKSL